LLMPESYRGENYADDNLGLVTWPGDTKEIHFGNPNIRRYEITLKKNYPSTSLILRWEEPRREEG
jgi:hypothetical protein